MLAKEIRYLIKKEILSEWKQKYAVSGILVYVISTVFVCYLSFKRIVDVPTWNALFWIIMLFASVNAIAKSFMQESRGRMLYLYTLCSPQGLILSKIIYNSVLMSALSLVCLGFYTLLVGNIIQDVPLYIIALLLGSFGFAGTFTLMSAIASKTENNVTLMAILSFPIILPFLITLIQLSKNAIDGIEWTFSIRYIVVLLLINVIVVVLSYLLFPYLWRD